MKREQMQTLRKVAAGIAAHFGSGCEVVIHDLAKSPDHTIVAIENGHVSGRKVGDGASRVVLEQMESRNPDPKDELCYLTRTPDGKVLKSSTLYIRDGAGQVTAILAINFDISKLAVADAAVRELISAGTEEREPERIVKVGDLLDDLIRRSEEQIGKAPALMTREEKIRAIRFLNEHGAFLITRSGDKVAKHFGISKYTLYSYMENRQEEN
ncbi:MAG: transcriptional regulator [Oscillibacter sp.]|nr:transcriptional regulator [Oscillibacter sp.]